MARTWKLTIAVGALCLVFAAIAGGAAAAASGAGGKKAMPKAGQLDPSFGQGGETAVSLPQSAAEAAARVAAAPSGKSYVLSGSLLLAFGANGKPDRGFGKNGRIEVAAAGGQTTKVADLTVDASGRILVTGSFEPVPGAVDKPVPAELTYAAPSQPISEAFVVRYLPNGERDPSFGTGGEIDTTLEVPTPNDPNPRANTHYERPTVYADRIAVVEGDQPVIGGEYVYSASYCYFLNVPSFAFAAHLDPGAPGARTLSPSAYTNLPETEVKALAPAPEGVGVLNGDGAGCPLRGSPERAVASRLTNGATLAPGLDPSRPPLKNLVDALGVDTWGRMLVVQGPVDFAPEETAWKLARLLPNGDVDTSFGSDGGMGLPGFAESTVRSISVDAKGRTLVGGGNKRFRVVRIGTGAKIDHSFGTHGWAEAGFGKGTVAELTATTIDAKGRIIAVGGVTDPALKTGAGVGIVRFLPGGN